MAVELEIHDGDPWWLSPDIWTVPGSDPLGTPDTPIVGEDCYLWARVTNGGKTPVDNAAVNFYWANPSVGFDRSSATFVGTAFVSLGPGVTQDVLCLTPWQPTFVNDGHECVLAEAFHSSLDPLPATPDFNVPTDRHVAQRNLNVIQIEGRMFRLRFEIHNTWRTPRAFRIAARPASPSEFAKRMTGVQLDLIRLSKTGKITRAGFVSSACPPEEALQHADGEVHVKLPGNGRMGLTLIGELEGGAAAVHVVQAYEGRVIGGLSAIVVRH